MELLLELIIVIFTTGLTEFLVYKHMRKIDRKERERLQKWEYNYVEELENKIKKLEGKE